MNAQQLRNSILQEAIEGRLVPQDPNDEPASVLLDRIREEKKRLVKEGKLKKKDLEETPISEDEKPFEIPDSWEWVRMSSLFNFIDYRGSTPQKITSGIPLVTAKNVKKGYNDYSIKDYISVEEYESRKSRGVSRKGDILFTTEAPLGNVSIADLDVFSTGQRLITLQSFDTNDINNVLIMFFMLSDSFQKSLIEKKTGTTVAGIKASKLKDVLLPLPPLAEQKRIVTKIEELLPKVEEYGKAQEALDKLNKELPERLKKSILQEAISGRLVPQDPNDEPASVLLDKIRKEKAQLVKEGKLKKKDLIETPITDDEKPFDIPQTWEWVRIKSILDVCSARRVHEKDWRSSGIPFYRAREIGKLADNGCVNNDLFIDQQLYDEFSTSGVPKEGDLMITAVGTLGKVYIVKEGEIFYYKDGSVLCMENKWKINSQYAKYVIESPVFINQYIGESQGTTVATLTMVRVNQYLFPLPPLAEQKRIVAKIEELFAEIDKLK